MFLCSVGEGEIEKEFRGPINATHNVIRIDDEDECRTPDDCTKDENAGERAASSSSAKLTPRLRVRRLSGDTLSGTNISDTPKDSASKFVEEGDISL